ncbi:hypothetical protein Bca52824_028022 [Brassica carinata]|uniref:Uncharacterized protein n=1 Tax=Brassica carinata TaxID=52824 RepID=A0A8X8AM43_BRACI|nr:hypothetical protein Bca52824_028022 [Brassica carinata]
MSTGRRLVCLSIVALVRETVTSAAYGAVAGAIFGGITGIVLTPLLRRHFRAIGLPPLSRAQNTLIGFRDCAAYTATGFGIESMLRGEDDIKYRLLLASGAGLAYTFLRHGFKAHPFHALSYVAAFTCVSGPTFQLRETLRARSEDSTRGKGF